MTENMKKLQDFVSQNAELKAKLPTMSKEDIIALANEHGVMLSEADFARMAKVDRQIISDEELENISGGGCKETWNDIWTGGTDHGS